jgi:hypothetical protein
MKDLSDLLMLTSIAFALSISFINKVTVDYTDVKTYSAIVDTIYTIYKLNKQ